MIVQVGKWFIVLVLALMTVTPVLAQQTYSDPAGRFTAKIPAGWTDESTPDYGKFTNSTGAVVYLLAVNASDVASGINTAIKVIDPSFNQTPAASSPVALPNGTWTQNIYTSAGGALQVAVGQLQNGVVYVIYIQVPNQAALQSQQNDMNSFLLNFTIGKVVDLSQQQPQKLTDAMLTPLTSSITKAMQQYQTVGAVVAVVQDGKVVYSQGFGTLKQGGTTPVTPQTLFAIGSASKSMTTMMTATLVDDGTLTWDKPVSDILPDFTLSDSTATAKIRVRDLFNMSSGLPRYDIPIYLQALTPQTVEQQIASIPLATPPGTAFHYSNLMDALGGYTNAVAAGAKLDDAYNQYVQLIQQRVFDPIGMSGTTLDFDTAVANPNHATPYTYDLFSSSFTAEPINFERFTTGIAPAGAVWSNADDMAKYLITELNKGIAPDGKRVVSEQNLLETWKPEVDMGNGMQYGMGWEIASYKGQRLIEHGGNTTGFSADLSFLPDANLGIIVLSNRALNINFGGAIREYVFETAFGLDHTADAYYSATEQTIQKAINRLLAQSGVQNQAVDPTLVAADVGMYSGGVQVSFKGSQLTLTTAYGDAPLFPTTQSGHFVTGGGLVGYDVAFSGDSQRKVTMTVRSIIAPITGDTSSYTLQKTG